MIYVTYGFVTALLYMLPIAKEVSWTNRRKTAFGLTMLATEIALLWPLALVHRWVWRTESVTERMIAYVNWISSTK